MSEKLCQLKRKSSLGGGFLEPREYLFATYKECTKGAYTSGTRFQNITASYPNACLINVSGVSGTLTTSGSGSGGQLGIYGIKNGNITNIATKTNSRSYSGAFSGYDYLMITAAAGGTTYLYVTITES